MPRIDLDPDMGQPPPGLRCFAGCGFLAEGDHRTANHLALLAGYVTLKAAELERAIGSGPDLRMFVESVHGQLLATAQLHRMLSHREDQPSVEIGRLIGPICKGFSDLASDQVMIVEDMAENCLVASDHGLQLGQIVSEAIVNAIKYAHPASGLTKVVVRCRSTPAGPRVEIIDNGRGLGEPGGDSTPGLGLRLIRMHARAIGAELSFQSASTGLTVRLALQPAPLA